MTAFKFGILLLMALAGCTHAVQIGTVAVAGFGSDKSCPSPPWNPIEQRMRERIRKVVFDKPFSTTPKVIVGFSKEDVKVAMTEDPEESPRGKSSVRLKTEARKVTPTGFDLFVGTWCNTKVYSAEVNWLAAE